MIPPGRGGGGPRILFVATDLSTGGGVNKVIRDLAVMFRRRFSADVTVVNARSDRTSSYEFPEDIPVQSHRRQSLFAYFLLLLRLRRSRPEVIVSSWTQDNILVTLAFLFSRTKTVLVEHSSWHFHRAGLRLLRRLIYPSASHVVVLNRRDLDHYRRYLGNVRLIPDPVTATPQNTVREKLIIAVGHLVDLKQFDHAIRAFARSGLDEDGWSIAIIGSGEGAPELQQLINSLGLKRARIYPPTDLDSWYARASLHLVTSRLESFSLVLAEAMISRVIPIAYASDGPSFILEDFPELLVDMGDEDALAARLAQLAKDGDMDSLRDALRTSAATRFSPDAIADEWSQVLSE
jgi:glycosyltransferase involved in cell wall biosynthesis